MSYDSLMINERDAVVLVCLAARPSPWTFRSLGRDLDVDPAALHRSVSRLNAARLLGDDREINRSNLEEFLVHGLRYVVPAELGPSGRGFPTAWGAEPLKKLLSAGGQAPPVWPDPQGEARGPVVAPISDDVLRLSKADPKLREWFALIDGIRIGRARERKLAGDELALRIWADGEAKS